VPELSRRKRAAFALATLGLSSLVSLAVAEAVLRGYDRRRSQSPPPPPERLDVLRPNPHGTGSYRLKPGVHLDTSVGGRRIRIDTNRHGMRWRDVAVEKEPGRGRIAILGDSFAFGCWADTVEQSLAGVFEAGLSRRRWEVLNFGVGGYGYVDMELQLREEVLRFAPDHVIVATFVGNDFRDTFLGLDRERIVDGTAELDEATVRRRVPPDLLVPDPPAPPAPRPRGLKRFALYRHLEQLLGAQDLLGDFEPSGNFMMLTFWSRVPYPEAARRARDESLATLARMDELVAAHHARLAVVAIPTREQVYARRDAAADYDIAFPQVYLQVFAREHGLPYLDLLPAFRARAREAGTRLYVRGDIHLSNEGHALAGRLVGEWFQCCVRAASIDSPAATTPTLGHP
jgi:hypothetical protein